MCAQCHPDKHETFIHTGMGSSFDFASQEKSSANFHGQAIYDSSTNLSYLPFFKGDELWIKEFELRDGDTFFQRSEKISYIVGSGQHTNSHLMYRNGYVVQAPLTYYTQKEKWDLPPGFENGQNSRFTRIIDSECMSCHNALPVMKENSTRQFEQIGRGIDCERCHGPGELHVQHRQKVGLKKTGEFDSTIVNPARLSSERLIDLCQRCHLQGNNVLRPGKNFSDFRPGMRLADVFEVYLPDYEGDNSSFNMADHSQRMQLSACFKGSNGQMNCIQCHNPHVSVKQTKKALFNQQCISCHEEKVCSLPLDERMKEDNSCFTCHMPLSDSKDIPHVEIHDHRIQIPKKSDNKEENRKLLGLYSVNNPKPDNEMLIKAYLSYYDKFDPRGLYLDKAEELLTKTEYIDGQIHLLFIQGSYSEIAEIATDLDLNEINDGFTAYRVAEALEEVGNLAEAELYFRRAIALQPDRFEFKDELGNLYLKQKKTEKARKIFTASIEQYPFNAKSYNNLAYSFILEADYPPAKRNLELALQLDHQYGPALENMALLYLALNQNDQALNYLYEAEKYVEDKEGILRTIKMIKDENE